MQKKLDGLMTKTLLLHRRITEATRPLIPVLLDAGRTNSAKPLQELFFELDATEQETASLIASDPTLALLTMFGRGKK